MPLTDELRDVLQKCNLDPRTPVGKRTVEQLVMRAWPAATRVKGRDAVMYSTSPTEAYEMAENTGLSDHLCASARYLAMVRRDIGMSFYSSLLVAGADAEKKRASRTSAEVILEELRMAWQMLDEAEDTLAELFRHNPEDIEKALNTRHAAGVELTQFDEKLRNLRYRMRHLEVLAGLSQIGVPLDDRPWNFKSFINTARDWDYE